MGFNYNYGYEYMEPATGDMAFAGVFLGLLLAYYLLVVGFGIAVYVIESLGFYSIAKRRGIHNPWLAWVPVGNLWVLGSISDQYQYVAKGRVRNRRKVLVALDLALVLSSVVCIIMTILLGVGSTAGMVGASAGMIAVLALAGLAVLVLSVLCLVFMYIALYDLYASCDPGNSVLYLVLSILFTVTIALLVFLCRKKDQGMPPRRQSVEQPVEEAQPEAPVVEETPAEEAPIEEAPAEEESVEETPAEETAAEPVEEEAPAEESVEA